MKALVILFDENNKYAVNPGSCLRICADSPFIRKICEDKQDETGRGELYELCSYCS